MENGLDKCFSELIFLDLMREPTLFLVSPCECDVARLRLSACDARDVSDAGDACPGRDRALILTAGPGNQRVRSFPLHKTDASDMALRFIVSIWCI